MFAGKTVLITGSSSGIGAHAALQFAKEQANLVLHGRNEESLKCVKEQCMLEHCQVVYVVGDICCEDVQEKLLNVALKNFHNIHVLVNNAGITKDTLIEDFDVEDYDEVMNVNLRSMVTLTMKCLPYLKKSKGSIINVSSIASRRPIPKGFAYCISKAGVDAFTKCLAAELATSGVRVNAINPGPVPTNILRDLKIGKPIGTSDIPMGRPGTTNETSDAILFLASDHSSFTTGITLAIDGGMSVQPIFKEQPETNGFANGS